MKESAADGCVTSNQVVLPQEPPSVDPEESLLWGRLAGQHSQGFPVLSKPSLKM